LLLRTSQQSSAIAEQHFCIKLRIAEKIGVADMQICGCGTVADLMLLTAEKVIFADMRICCQQLFCILLRIGNSFYIIMMLSVLLLPTAVLLLFSALSVKTAANPFFPLTTSTFPSQ
jgi:hypothetical protein